MTTTRRRASRYVTTTVEVDVDLGEYLDEADREELDELGLHRASECGSDPETASTDLYAALNALHQQAHDDQPLFVDTCLREPCRSLSLRKFPQLGSAR